MKTIELPDHSLVTQEMVMKLDHLLFSSNPTRLKNHITLLFMNYLEDEHRTLPVDFEDQVTDLRILMEFLVVAEEEVK